jgi:phosphoribosylformylglycinamidine synthase
LKFHFEVVVRLKKGLLDPQGKAIEDSLPHLGWTNVTAVRVGKHIEFDLEAEDPEVASRQAEEMGEKLLSNPVIESVDLQWKMADLPDGRIAMSGERAVKLEAHAGEPEA